MKTNICLLLAAALIISNNLMAGIVTLSSASFGDTSVWEYLSYPLPYAEESSLWGPTDELGEHRLPDGELFWGIEGLAKNEEEKAYYHTLRLMPKRLENITNAFFEFSYFADGLDKGENLQWGIACDTTNLFGSFSKSRQDTSSLWERVELPVPAEADAAGLIFRIKQQGASDFAGIGCVSLKGTACQERGGAPSLAVASAGWDGVDLKVESPYAVELIARAQTSSAFVTNRPNAQGGLTNARTTFLDAKEFYDEDVLPGGTYYYKAWGIEGSNAYSCGSALRAVVVSNLPVIDVEAPSMEAGTLDDAEAVVKRPDVDGRLAVLVDLATSRDFLPDPTLFISEYGKGSSNNRYLEIYNPCSQEVSLDGLSVCVFKNGSETANQKLDFFGSLPSYETLLIANNKAAAELTNAADIVSAKIDFTGNDAVALIRGEEVIDVIGVIGEDPGTAWPIGEYASGTANHTLIRYPYVNHGSRAWKSNEWEVLEKDFFADLKRHECSETREGTLVSEGLFVPEEGLSLTNLEQGVLYYLRAKTAYKGVSGAYGGAVGPFLLVPEPCAVLFAAAALLMLSSLRSRPH